MANDYYSNNYYSNYYSQACKCKNGQHRFKTIQTITDCDDSCRVIRWCDFCGSIVVDFGCDGRTMLGGVMKLTLPEMLIYNTDNFINLEK